MKVRERGRSEGGVKVKVRVVCDEGEVRGESR